MPSPEERESVTRYGAFFSREEGKVVSDLESYAQLLRKWSRAQNLVSRETLSEVWTRHFADSLQLLPLIRDTDSSFLDLGSGGGLPALPLAIATKGAARTFLLVESSAKKSSFLRAVTRELGLAVVVNSSRIEQIAPRETFPDVITSRALASLNILMGLAEPLFGPGTRALLHKGGEHVEELEESAALWQYDVIIHSSEIDPSGVVLEISNLRMKP